MKGAGAAEAMGAEGPHYSPRSCLRRIEKTPFVTVREGANAVLLTHHDCGLSVKSKRGPFPTLAALTF